MARFNEALEQLRIAKQLDPNSLDTYWGEEWWYYLQRRFDDVIEHCLRTIQMDSTFYPPYQALGQAYAAKQMYKEAIATFQTARILSGNAIFAVGRLGHAFAQSGQKTEAQQLLHELKESANREL